MIAICSEKRLHLVRVVSGVLLGLLLAGEVSAGGPRPNIVWIMGEDISTELACYGHPAVRTPNLDRLAQQGARYTHAFCTAPSCTPSRNAMMTGVYQTRTDTQDQRRRGVILPAGMMPITELYDIQQDPHELNNFSPSVQGQETLLKLRELLDRWIADTEDKGLAQLNASVNPSPASERNRLSPIKGQ